MRSYVVVVKGPCLVAPWMVNPLKEAGYSCPSVEEEMVMACLILQRAFLTDPGQGLSSCFILDGESVWSEA